MMLLMGPIGIGSILIPLNVGLGITLLWSALATHVISILRTSTISYTQSPRPQKQIMQLNLSTCQFITCFNFHILLHQLVFPLFPRYLFDALSVWERHHET